MPSVLSDKHFHNEQAAYTFVEERVWPNGPVCPHCGGFERIGKMGGKSTRIGTYKCYQCRKPFTVKIGTIFEDSHVKLNLWLQAIFLMVSSKKGISSNQLHRTLGVTLKTAWFMSHRIRLAMSDNGDFNIMGGKGKVVEADETYFGDKAVVTKRKKSGKSTHSGKRSIVALVERGGSMRSFHVERATQQEVGQIVRNNVYRETVIHTDESKLYAGVKSDFAGHQTVCHSDGEYVRGVVHTNTIEGCFSIFKRGMKGVYQHCAEKHLHRYLAEFDFRYNNRVKLGINDDARADRAIKGIVGKRLTYRLT